MNNLSTETKRFVAVVLLLALAAVLFVIRENTTVHVSSDPLSVGIGERWNAALPSGFEKESAEHDDFNVARLVFKKDIERYLIKWAAPDADFAARYDALLTDAAESPAFTDAEKALANTLRAAPPDASWITYALRGEDAPESEILLAYHKETHTMLIAERLVPNS